MFKNVNTHEFGVFCVVSGVALGSLQDVYLGHLFANGMQDPISMLFGGFGLATVFFLVLNLGAFGKLLRLSVDHLGAVLVVNILSALCWMGAFLSLKHLEPAIVASFLCGIGPMVLAFFWKTLRPNRRVTLTEKFSAISIFCGLFLMSIGGVSAPAIETSNTTIGLFWALTAGLSMSFLALYMKKLYEVGFSARATMAVRYWALIGLAFFLLPSGAAIPSLSQTPLWILCVATIILPSFVIQLGIARLEPITVKLISATSPGVVYLLQLMDDTVAFSSLTLMGVLVCFLASLLGILASKKAYAPFMGKRFYQRFFQRSSTANCRPC